MVCGGVVVVGVERVGYFIQPNGIGPHTGCRYYYWGFMSSGIRAPQNNN